MQFDLTNFTIAAPLLALAAGALVVLLLDLLAPAKGGQPFWYIAGLGAVAVSGYYLAPLWGKHLVGFNGALIMDPLALALSVVILGSVLLTVFLSFGRSEEDKSGYLALVLWGGMGMLVMVAAGNLMTIFLGLELLSLALYVAVAFDPKRPQAREAAFKYFVLGSVSSAFLLFGFAFIYGATGTMDLAAISKAAAAVATSSLYFKLGLGLSLVGFFFKLALVPFHVWAPDVYEGAPTAITALMSIGVKVAGFGVLARFLVAAVPAGKQGPFMLPITIVAIASMVLGATAGIWQNDLKRLMGYSSISHAGILMLALAGLGAEGFTAGTYYLAAYGFAIMGTFAVVALLEAEGQNGSSFDVLSGLYWRRPGLAIAMAIFMTGMFGLPPTGNFVGEFLMAKAAVGAHAWAMLIGFLITYGISAFVYMRVLGVILKKPAAGTAAAAPAVAVAQDGLQLSAPAVRFGLLVVLVVGTVGTLWLGILPASVLSLLRIG